MNKVNGSGEKECAYSNPDPKYFEALKGYLEIGKCLPCDGKEDNPGCGMRDMVLESEKKSHLEGKLEEIQE